MTKTKVKMQILTAFACATLMASSVMVCAEPLDQTTRWVLADRVRVRAGPSLENPVNGFVSRGAELVLKAPAQGDFCLIEGEGRNGYIACKFLSAERVERLKAGANGIDAAQRWVTGDGLAVRYEPRGQAGEIIRLPLNTVVKLIKEGAGPESAYCEIEHDGQRGYSMCRYLALSPVVSMSAQSIRSAKSAPDVKEYTADPPMPFVDWIELKRMAREDKAKPDLTSPERQSFSSTIQSAGDSLSARNLILALEFPAVTPSLFGNEAEVAPPNSRAEHASGRFGIAVRSVVTSRSKPEPYLEEDGGAGPNSWEKITTALVRPVQRVQLFRDGKFRTSPSALLKKDAFWKTYEGDEISDDCEGWFPGFSFGAADANIWNYFDYESKSEEKRNVNPRGSLVAFYTTIEMPSGRAVRTETSMKLNRKATGFVRGIQLQFDLNGDGIADIAIWEGEGKGPGHREFPGKTDDRWYRLAMVNIAGKWKVLGVDTFSYGCGC